MHRLQLATCRLKRVSRSASATLKTRKNHGEAVCGVAERIRVEVDAMRLALVKRLVVGAPMPLAQARHERLSKTVALAVFASDPLSSVAYATEEILLVLMLGGAAALSYSLPVGIGIGALLATVVVSYRQTVAAYPQGGGAYIVAKDNLGQYPALIAAAALLVDYVLTVSVSVVAGIAALTSAAPTLHP